MNFKKTKTAVTFDKEERELCRQMLDFLVALSEKMITEDAYGITDYFGSTWCCEDALDAFITFCQRVFDESKKDKEWEFEY